MNNKLNYEFLDTDLKYINIDLKPSILLAEGIVAYMECLKTSGIHKLHVNIIRIKSYTFTIAIDRMNFKFTLTKENDDFNSNNTICIHGIIGEPETKIAFTEFENLQELVITFNDFICKYISDLQNDTTEAIKQLNVLMQKEEKENAQKVLHRFKSKLS